MALYLSHLPQHIGLSYLEGLPRETAAVPLGQIEMK